MFNSDDNGQPAAKLDIVIVNWNSGDLLRGCLATLASSSIAANLKVVVVDNASNDGSREFGHIPQIAVEVLRNRENRGFAAACNQGAARGRAPFVLFLNPDTRVAPNTLADLLFYMADPANDDVGIAGVRLVDEAGQTQRTCAREPTFRRLVAQNAGLDRLIPNAVRPHFMTDWDHRETREVDQVMGAFLLIRRSLFRRIGRFDERYFVYYEDVDLCTSARRAGARVVHFAGAAAWHQGGGTTNQVRDRRLFYMMTSQALYAHKWFGRVAALTTLLSALVLHIPVRVVRAVLSSNHGEASSALRGGWLLLRNLPGVLPVISRPNLVSPVLDELGGKDRSTSA
jgi:GT2 family glycosyltransferase